MSKPSIVEVVTYVTGLASVSMSLNLSDLNVLNAVVNGVFAYRRDRREQRESDARTARRTEPS
jgi:hypothetical protein